MQHNKAIGAIILTMILPVMSLYQEWRDTAQEPEICPKYSFRHGVVKNTPVSCLKHYPHTNTLTNQLKQLVGSKTAQF